jgi:hypothetical protein
MVERGWGGGRWTQGRCAYALGARPAARFSRASSVVDRGCSRQIERKLLLHMPF